MIRSSETAAARSAVASVKHAASSNSSIKSTHLSDHFIVADRDASFIFKSQIMSIKSDKAAPALSVAHKQQANAHQLAGLEVFIVCRYELLSTDEQMVIRTMAIIGLNIDMLVIRDIVPDKMAATLPDALEKLMKQNWLFAVRDSGRSNAFQFVHPLFRQVLYNLTPASERTHIHKAIAQFYMKSHASGLTFKTAEVIAHHLTFCDAESSVHFQIEAASLALLDEAHAVDLCVELLSSNGFLSRLKDPKHLQRVADVILDAREVLDSYLTMAVDQSEKFGSNGASSTKPLWSAAGHKSCRKFLFSCCCSTGKVVPGDAYFPRSTTSKDADEVARETTSDTDEDVALQNVYTIEALHALVRKVEGLSRVVHVRLRGPGVKLEPTKMAPICASLSRSTSKSRLLARTRSHMGLKSRITGDVGGMFRDDSVSAVGRFFDTR